MNLKKYIPNEQGIISEKRARALQEADIFAQVKDLINRAIAVPDSRRNDKPGEFLTKNKYLVPNLDEFKAKHFDYRTGNKTK